MAWGASNEHGSKYGDRDPRGQTHSDIEYRDESSGKIDHSAGKGYISGSSQPTNFVDSLSDPGNPASTVPRT